MSLNSQKPESPGAEKYLSLIIYLLVGWYLLLCTQHYFNQRPLWNDEACVFQSVKTFTPRQMFGEQLKALQVFPRAYLFFIQRISEPFGFSLLSLRFLSFVAMMCAFFIWLRLAQYELRNKLEYLTFVLSWGASALLIYYSAELKQYSMDVLAAAVFLSFLYNQQRLEKDMKTGHYALICALLPALGMFSYTAFLFMFFPLYNLMYSARANPKVIKCVIVYVISFVVFLFLSYCFDMRLRPVSIVTEGFGDYFVSFESMGEFFKTFGEGLTNLFSRWFAERPRIIKKIAIFFVSFGTIDLFYAFFANIKKDKFYFKSLNTIALILFGELFVLGALKKYPFVVPRTVLFYCPIVLYLTVRGIKNLQYIHRYLYRTVHGLYIVFLSVVSISLARLIFGGDLGGMPKLW